jgi:hypothetical protein
VVPAPPLIGGLLFRSWFTRRRDLRKRKEELRRQTLESEVLKLARLLDGSLGAIDLVIGLGISGEEAESVLDSFAVQGAAEAAGDAVVEAGGMLLEGAGEALSAVSGLAEGAMEGVGEVVTAGFAEGAAEGVAGAAGGMAEVAVEAVGSAAESVAEAILEFILELIGDALG